ncbi:ABC-F family ATP-binding cassette domain-containing protein [Legionella israelensis]|uniref:Probable ATP-binding protein YheS n=1 Tax=Legionella israelensis TaxID=454 RepID=A0A0W0WBL6_9GAMM|nr:ATP-binding cassette domain-containing protein [Legionella israelensis]KTD29751.1 ABC transporter ATP binding protein [Legionella israelensis]QBS08876.1 ATP-binding cassette domain-containing protein [Legionella israelensis]SCY02848.1 ATP-binding cassette, subfamily F, member 3 [Legionella israelensis DSM 19235]STX58562.1 ABC transporter ATP binding protein [Legionella israelensis]
MITIQQVTLTRGNKQLLDKASASLHEKQKIGLIGQNGCGKSSLFSLILGELTVDHGECQINTHLRISHLSQQLPDSTVSALEFVLAGDEDYSRIQQQLNEAEKNGDDKTILVCHEELAQTSGYSKPAQAATIMAGLGFSNEEQSLPVNHFSGGWRMRLSLARCLMKPADLLLLDEPTNHLDMEAIFWLERWLKQSPCSIILISHDREFLDAVVSHILHIEHQKAILYSGNYSRFEQTRAEKLALQQAQYEKQQSKIKHMMSFVNRFKAKATKAKQAQSRIKAIEKMEQIAQAQLDSPFSFEFYPCPKAGKPLVSCEKMGAGYSETIILKNISLSLNPGDRIALLGPNGEGKSTFIKTLTGALSPLSGTVYRNSNLTIGYYAQHQLEELDDHLSPMETIQLLSPEAKEQIIRDFLGSFNFMGDMAVHSIQHFSGGEKARLALAKLVWQKPNLLLLDEPTNHLDLTMRSAIEIALQSYEGALILISHDRHLLRTSVDDFYLIYQQKVQPFKGDLDDYYQWLLNKKHASSSDQPPTISANMEYKQRKTAQNRLKKLEQIIEVHQAKLQKLETILADNELYENTYQMELNRLLNERHSLQHTLNQAESEWLELMTELEENR